MNVLLALLAAYLIGSIPTSYLAGRVAGMDLREHGSKNLGATNVFRVLGWKYAIPVFVLDAAKGAVPVIYLAPVAGSQAWMPLLIGTTAVLGHIYTVFLNFKGGKGVATAAGVMIGMAPLTIALAVGLWFVVVLISRYVSLGSLVATAAFPVIEMIVEPGQWYTLAAGALLASLIWYTHRANLRRLLAGTEARFGRPSKREEA